MSHARARSLKPEQSHVVVVGAGGIGCPAAWGLAEAGVGRVTVVDPDEVALSNLPRQVLYRAGDVGRPKALLAAERLAGLRGAVTGEPERLDHQSEARLLADCDLVLDATDGARTKDWLNALAVRRRLPLVHAAGLRSEGRILDVRAGGAPCLACLFGRLEAETGSCADLGVWGGVVGAIGFLAAASAIWRLANPDAPSRGYAVLDLEAGRTITLGAEASPDCPVCRTSASGDPEPYPETAPCDVGAPQPADATVLDLVGEECPLNLLRARQAVEALDRGAALEIRLGAEGRESVPEGLRALGHELVSSEALGTGLRLIVKNGAVGALRERPLDRDLLLRFARQVVLPEVGEAGQRRLLEARVRLEGQGPAFDTAAVYLAAAGVRHLHLDEPAFAGDRSGGPPSSVAAELDGVPACRVAAWRGQGALLRGPGDAEGAQRPLDLGSVSAVAQRAAGAILADAVSRQIAYGKTEPPDVVVLEDGTIGAVPANAT